MTGQRHQAFRLIDSIAIHDTLISSAQNFFAGSGASGNSHGNIRRLVMYIGKNHTCIGIKPFSMFRVSYVSDNLSGLCNNVYMTA
jgi:hypothetical protein